MASVSLSLPFIGNFAITQPYGPTSNTYEPPGHGYGPPGKMRWHQGIDYGLPCGTQLYAMGDGTVYHNSYEYGTGYGVNVVTIDHGQGVTSLLGHLSRKDVTDGQVVKRGDPVGLSGGGTGNAAADGNSTGCHVHVGVLLDGWHDQDLNLYLNGQGPTGQTVSSVPPVLTPEQAAYYARAAGVPEDQLAIAVSIAMAESGLQVAAHNHNAANPQGADACSRSGSDDYGLWQVNTCYHPEYDATSLTTDPLYNARAMVAISNGGVQWAGTWSSYPARSTGFLARAQAAVASPDSHRAPDFTIPVGVDASGGASTDSIPQDTTPQQKVITLFIEPVTERFADCVRKPGQEDWLSTFAVKIAGYWLPGIDLSVATTQYLAPGRFSCTLGLDDVRARTGDAVEHALYEVGWQQITIVAGYAPPRIQNGQTVPDVQAVGGPDALPTIFTGIITQQRPLHTGAQRRIALAGGDLSLIASSPSATNSSFGSTQVNQSGFDLVRSLWLAHNPPGYSGLSIKGSGAPTKVGSIFGQDVIQTRQSGRTEWQAMVQAAQAEGAALYMDGSTLVYGPIPTPPPPLHLPVDVAGVRSLVSSVQPEINPHNKRDYQVIVNSTQLRDGSLRQAIGGNHDATETATIWEHANMGQAQLQQHADYYATFYAATEKILFVTCVEPVGVSRGQPVVLQSESLYRSFTDPAAPSYTAGVTFSYGRAAGASGGVGLRQTLTLSSRPLAVLGTEQASSLGTGF